MMDAPGRLHRAGEPGQPRRVSIRELAELVLELTGRKSRIVSQPRPPDDPPANARPDISLAESPAGLDADGAASRRPWSGRLPGFARIRSRRLPPAHAELFEPGP